MRIHYVIYDKPRDYPSKIVVRPFQILFDSDGQPVFQPHTVLGLVDSLEEARALIPPGLACFGRDSSDPRSIVETWI